ncbi:MAG TPA: isoprenylcysteine carboxylmethyltransferase family protein [Burkholderiaceae bacterium]|jgi:protein-S-isoprenylcysteine O-methyltransferase Ste14|nr:isoprenylcysteine carboxylmethyltransferase family protein [Burkholderiaceae bacterium]
MNPAARFIFPAMWIAWALYWWASSLGVKAVVRRESIASRALHIVPLMLAVTLMMLPDERFAALRLGFLTGGARASWAFWLGAALTLAGLLFTVWARVHLAGNWSGTVTLKAGHELVTTGPYRLVRHPIYTGLLLAFLASALALGEWRGVLAFAIVAAALWRKLRLEERWMREAFGETYERYCERVPALVPFTR